MAHLLRHVGERLARWLLLTGELVDAIQALPQVRYVKVLKF